MRTSLKIALWSSCAYVFVTAADHAAGRWAGTCSH